MNKYNGKLNKVLIIAGFLALLAVNALILPIEYGNYEDKMQLLYQMGNEVQTKEEGLERAGSILKGQKRKETKERQMLFEEYGYGKEYTNAFQKGLYGNYVKIICITFAVYVLYLIIILTLPRIYIGWYKKELEELDRNIRGFLDGTYQTQTEKETWKDGIKGRLMMDMESLSSYINMVRQRSSEEKEETKSLVTDISHQLKTPLAALKTSFEILNSEGLSCEEREEFKERCTAQMIRLEELIGALVNISRMETGMIEIHPIEACIYDTVTLAVSRIYPDAEKKMIEISFEAEEELRQLQLWHDPKWIAEAFINVLENAVKYSKEGKNITIRMVKMSMFLRIEFEDEGLGIPKTERNKVFLRFYRGMDDDVQKKPGSGVGLYLAREILERHHGTIAVQSRLGQGMAEGGSRFVIQIPLNGQKDTSPFPQ